MMRIPMVLLTLAFLAGACGNGKSDHPSGPTYVGSAIVRPRVLETIAPSTATPVGGAMAATTPGVSVKIVSVSDGHPGANATVTAETAPNTPCSITYHHPSGKLSTTQGLEPRASDANGAVTWTFRIDSTTKAGNGNIAVTCDGATAYHVISIKAQ